jgi:hypothetical protein
MAVRKMIEFLYKGDYDPTAHTTWSLDHGNFQDHPLILESRVYALAEHLRIPRLKEYVASRYNLLADRYWDVTGFVESARKAYNGPISTEPLLRNKIVDIAKERIQDLREETIFLDLLRRESYLAVDILQAVLGPLPETPTRMLEPEPTWAVREVESPGPNAASVEPEAESVEPAAEPEAILDPPAMTTDEWYSNPLPGFRTGKKKKKRKGRYVPESHDSVFEAEAEAEAEAEPEEAIPDAGLEVPVEAVEDPPFDMWGFALGKKK